MQTFRNIKEISKTLFRVISIHRLIYSNKHSQKRARTSMYLHILCVAVRKLPIARYVSCKWNHNLAWTVEWRLFRKLVSLAGIYWFKLRPPLASIRNCPKSDDSETNIRQSLFGIYRQRNLLRYEFNIGLRSSLNLQMYGKVGNFNRRIYVYIYYAHISLGYFDSWCGKI